ncbi:3063_t:CDS:2, partial [Scutellospora calospora]
YGVKEDFCALYNKYHFIKANNKETIMEAYKRINDESEAIAKKTNGRIDIHKSRNYTLTTIKFFKETTLAPQKSKKISEQESVWIDLATTGALIFAERYEGKANQYDPIAPATIEGNPSKKSLQCMRYLRYNPHRIYTYYDLELSLINILPNTLIYERNVCITGKNMFGEWGNILYKIKKEGGIEGKVSKALLVSLWNALSEKVELKMGIEMGELKFEKNRVCVVKNCISITWKLSYPEIPNLIIFKENELHSTNSLSDFEKIQQDKKQNTILDIEYPASQTAKRKLLKKSDINLLNEIIIEIF